MAVARATLVTEGGLALSILDVTVTTTVKGNFGRGLRRAVE